MDYPLVVGFLMAVLCLTLVRVQKFQDFTSSREGRVLLVAGIIAFTGLLSIGLNAWRGNIHFSNIELYGIFLCATICGATGICLGAWLPQTKVIPKDPLPYSMHIHWSPKDNAFIATSEEFPGLSAFGNTHEQAAHEAQVAMQLFLEEQKK